MRSTTLIRVLRAAADADPERVVYRYLADGERESASLTRGQLDDRARRIAAILQRRFSPGERVVLLFPSGLDFAAAFWGSLYAGVIAVPVAVPRATGDTRTLEGIVRSAAARGLLGPAGILQDFAGLEATRGVAQVALEEADRAPASLWQEPRVSGSDLAYLQYTSGSTASPKGVMVSHENVLRNIEYIDSGFRHTPESLCVVWLPHYHDMGLVYGMVQPVCTGAASVLFPPLKFVQRPLRWLAVITRWRATHSGAPNFAYDLCCRRVSAADRAELDLSSWSVAFNGAEPVRAATLREFAATFASCGFRASALCPAYGLAEATLKVTARDPERPAAVESTAPFAPARADLTALAPAREVVGCGSANGGTEVLIVDPDTCAPVPCGAVGEIWVRGPGVALGYWNLPEETERVFHARVSGGGAICFLRTGDLGFSRDGELFVTGRLKDLVIIRGQNYYPEDLEAAAAAADAGLRSSGVATFALDTDDGERAVIAAEVERSRDTAALDSMARRIAAAVQSRHQIPIHAVAILRRGGLPRTTSGKVQRHECRRRFAAGELDAMHVLALGDAGTPEVDRVTRQTLEACDAADRMPLVLAYVRRAVAAAARLPLEHVEADAVLTATGVDSLAASELCARFAEDLAVEIAPVRLLSGMTVRALVADLAARLEQAPASAWGAGEDEPGAYPLSCAQESLWASYALDPASAAYNIARAFRCTGPFDVPAFRACVGRLVERHSALRTTVANTLEGPMRVVHPRGSVTVLFDDASAWREADLMERIRQVATWPFLVEADALLRVAVFRRADQHIVVLCAHHIAVDLQSMEIVLEELGELYGAAVAGREAPPPVPSGAYGAFVDWHRQLLTGDTGARLWSYWRRVLGGEPPVLELPSDYSREAVRSHAGGTRTATVPADVHD
ncbi:MAG: AMP-binding protein, partial [Vicinamibacterales bacterium]